MKYKNGEIAKMSALLKQDKRDISNIKNSYFLHISALCVIGILYYGSFYNYGFLWSDEGSVAVIAEKLLNNEKPYVDINIGYGLLWYLPIVLLFKLFGVKFYLIRILFLGIGLASALVAYAIMMNLSERRLIAFMSALLVLLFPGCIYQTYIPFLEISGLYVLLLYDSYTLKSRINPGFALFISGAYLGVTYLIRGDIATIFTLLFILNQGVLVVQGILRGDRSLFTLLKFFNRILIVAFMVVIITWPFTIEAKSQGYFAEFLQQYSYFVEELVRKIQQRFYIERTNGASVAGSLMPGIRLNYFFQVGWVYKGLIFLTYVPAVLMLSILLFLAVDFGVRRRGRVGDFIAERSNLLMLLLGTLSTFPQFFIWRPDIPHLSGFIPGFFLLIIYFITIFVGYTNPYKNSLIVNLPSLLLVSIFGAYVFIFSIYYDHGPKIFEQNVVRLQMDKGVDLYMPRWKFDTINQLTSKINKFSKSGEFVLCFPYCPGFNFLTDRPTFQKYLYVDDSFLNFHPEWIDDMARKIETLKPKVIIVDDYAPNQNEISRFRTWAKPLYNQITKSYRRESVINNFEVFVYE